MAAVARRHQALTAEIAQLDTALETLAGMPPRPDSWPAKAWAPRSPPRCWSPPATTLAACAPTRASPRCAAPARFTTFSGKQRRYRLNRGGDRQGNSRPVAVGFTRMGWSTQHPRPTWPAAQPKVVPREIIRCLKRYIARELYKALTGPHPAAGPAHHIKNFMIT